MKLRHLVIALALFAVSPAFAQQGPQPTVQEQLYTACGNTNTQLAKMIDTANVQLAKQTDDLAKAQARIKELESK
jgi:hypothetical protein